MDAFDAAFGLRELRAKVNGKAGVRSKNPPNRFSTNTEFCYGSRSVEIVRKFLDSGVLTQCLEDDFFKNDRFWNGEDGYRFNVLAACAMSLGCTLPKNMKDCLVKMQYPAYQSLANKRQPRAALKPKAMVQMKTAVATYEDGKPYNYGNKTFLEFMQTSMFPGKASPLIDVGSSKLIKMTQANGMVIPQLIGPRSDEELGLTPIYPNHVCAACGSKEGQGGAELSVCARCIDRKFCGKACQKQHWKAHKIICTRPAEQMKAFMDSIPLDFKDDAKKAMDSFFVLKEFLTIAA